MADALTVRKFRQTAGINAAQVTQAAGGTPAQVQSSANAAQQAASLLSSDPSTDSTQAAAQLATIQRTEPIAFAVATQLVVSGAFAKWELESAALNPIGGITRRKPFPVKLLPQNITLSSAGAGQVTWQPQEEFEPFRLVVPSGQASLPCLLSQLQAGDRNMMAQTGSVPAACWGEKTDLGRIDFPIVRLGETLAMTVSGGVASTEFCAILIGYARGKARKLPEGAVLLYERVEPFSVTSVPALGTATITLQPQRNIVLRRLGLDDTVTNFANLFVTSINVQDDPQFVQGAEFPASLFSELAQDDWLDFDMCQLGGTITIGLRNSHATAAVNAQGMALADLVRLPGDAR